MRSPTPSRRGEINWYLVDRFTFVHFLIGVFYAYMGLSFVVTLFLALLWEVIENPLKAYFPRMFPHATADTWANSLGDTISVCLGWYVVRQISS